MREQNRFETSDLKNKTVEELEALLQDSFADADTDPAFLIAVTDAIREKEQNAGVPAPDAEQAWEDFRQYYQPEEPQEKKTLSPAKPKKRVLRTLFRLGEVAAMALLVVVLSMNAAGVNPVQALLHWNDCDVLVYGDPAGLELLPEDELEKQDTLKDAIQASGLQSELLPRWIPSDYSLRLATVRETDGVHRKGNGIARFYAVCFSRRGELVISITDHRELERLPHEMGDLHSDGRWYEYRDRLYLIDGSDDFTRRNEAIWQEGTCLYSIAGNVTEEELIRMVQSIPQ